ncbi:hypothetical protein [Limoniibacter endophyticus]|uniref:Uncharacterized protein n=1 Tax=Limoniibacter endophyticus TaxID=1565040 RepID=A0A8J3GI23_9HYPH|nr:hypothetical protein [Limoniibacter endophyticus]GHC75507.1 hypothetical protein GCM10010136_25520 [Limoniibacter endophyticus]
MQIDAKDVFKRTTSSAEAKHETTTRTALKLIETERMENIAKTKRLRAARLAAEAQAEAEKKVEEKKPAKAPKKRTTKRAS